MRGILPGLLAGTALCAPASAGAQEWAQSYDAMRARLVEVGNWEFQATRPGPDVQPECVESWTFNADGSGLIVSGEQRVTIRWSTSRYEGSGHQLLFYDDGMGALICFEGEEVARSDGSRFRCLGLQDCWGRIVPAAQPEADDED